MQNFRYRKEQSEKKLKRILQYGRRTLLIALGLLVVLFYLTAVVIGFWPENKIAMLIHESFVIFAWVVQVIYEPDAH